MSITLSSAAPRAHVAQANAATAAKSSDAEATTDTGWSNLTKGAILGGIAGVVVGAGLLLAGVANSRFFINGAFAGSSLDLGAAALVGGGSIAAGSALGAGVGLVLDH